MRKGDFLAAANDLIERVWPLVHEAWRQEKLQAGVTSRPSALSGQEQLVPAEELAEVDKESNRAQVRAVLRALVEAGCIVSIPPSGPSGRWRNLVKGEL